MNVPIFLLQIAMLVLHRVLLMFKVIDLFMFNLFTYDVLSRLLRASHEKIRVALLMECCQMNYIRLLRTHKNVIDIKLM